MYRFFLYLILTYLIYFVLKIIINYIRLRNKTQRKTTDTEKKQEPKIDKTKAIDAKFEEIK